MSDSPDREQIAADEHRIGDLLRAVEAPAPPGLTHRIAARNEARRWWQGAPALALGLSGAASAACVALILLLTSGGSATPTVVQASLVALERPTAPAPAALRAAGTRITFPDWRERGWPETGTRSDTVGGRAVTTVFYRSAATGTVGYAIVAGAPLRWGAGGRTEVSAGERYGALRSGGAEIVTWVEEGHTCILASRTATADELWSLALSQARAAAASAASTSRWEPAPAAARGTSA